ncbi:MAG: zf-HC2 domain-containing protein [bacterium]|nr:zf-HC2 domain-containing protein [bacterium]
METCEKFHENVILYMEGSLKSQEKEKFVLHLKNCKRCQRYLKYIQMLISEKVSDADDEYWNNLTKRIIDNINNFCTMAELRILRLKGLFIGLLCLSFLIMTVLKEHHKNQEIVRHYHLYKDLPVIEKLDELQELCAFEK